MIFDEDSFVLKDHFGFTYKVYNQLYGTYACDEHMRTLIFSSHKEAREYCERHNLNRNVYEIV